VFAMGRGVATRVNGPVPYAGCYLPLGDHLDSLHVLANCSGTEVQRLTYLPFGETHTNAGTVDFDQYRFTGQERDPETGLYYYKARYYNPRLGRFISPDPLVSNSANPQTLNRYSYVRNNPLRFRDPTGLLEDGGDCNCPGAGGGEGESGEEGGWGGWGTDGRVGHQTEVDMIPAEPPSPPATDQARKQPEPDARPDTVVGGPRAGVPATEPTGGLRRGFPDCQDCLNAPGGGGGFGGPGGGRGGLRGSPPTGAAPPAPAPGSRPPNLAPPGASRHGAFAAAKRHLGIPQGQQPKKVGPNVNRRTEKVPGRTYSFSDPKNPNKELTIRDDVKGHYYGPNDPQNRGPHFNTPDEGHFDYRK
jgi:RHS repeat-associated protein